MNVSWIKHDRLSTEHRQALHREICQLKQHTLSDKRRLSDGCVKGGVLTNGQSLYPCMHGHFRLEQLTSNRILLLLLLASQPASHPVSLPASQPDGLHLPI